MQAVLSHERPGHTFSAFTSRIPDVESFTLELGKARPFGANTGLDTAAFEQAITALSEAREMATHPDLALPPRMRVASSLIKLSEPSVSILTMKWRTSNHWHRARSLRWTARGVGTSSTTGPTFSSLTQTWQSDSALD